MWASTRSSGAASPTTSWSRRAARPAPSTCSRGRADAWAYSGNGGGYALQQRGVRERVRVTLILKSGANYFAFNPDTDQAAIGAFRESVYALKREGRIADIRQRYLRRPGGN